MSFIILYSDAHNLHQLTKVFLKICLSRSRFLAIWWPLKMQLSKRRARIMIGCIWIVALSSTIPWALFFQLVPLYQDSDIILCREVWPPGLDGSMYFLVANVFACYLVPMSLISLCYILIWIKVSQRSIPGDSNDAQMERMQQKSKIKVVKMLIAVVILFILSWFPLYAIFARIKFGKYSIPNHLKRCAEKSNRIHSNSMGTIAFFL